MSRRKLLLADDSVTIQKVVNLTFADEGIEVFAVGDGIEAVDRLMEISPDLVMADVNMPGINGYQVCERIKQHEKFRNTPVILLVGSFEPFDEQEASRVGADDYLTKPFQSIRQLVSKVTDLLERSQTETVEPTPLENSFADTQEIEPPAMEAEVVEQQETPRYDDAGYDDEMIQTNQASGFAFDEAQKFSSGHYVEPREEDYGKTQPLSDVDLKEIQSAPDQYVSAPQENYSSTAQEDSTTPEQTYSGEVLQPQPASRFESDDDDDFLELFDDDEFEDEEEEETIQPQAQAATANEVSAESQATAVSETENYQTTAETGAYQTAETENVQSSEENAESPEAFVTQPIEAEAVESTEAESVYSAEPEIAPTGETEFAQTAETETAQTGETESVQPAAETEAMAATASSQQLSPEMIDAIAQRVIEKLSENAVKEIAWEVVPQQADLIIKKMVEEKLKE